LPYRASDRGSSSLLVVGLIGVVLVITVGALALASAVVASHHARTAADLGALAGAMALRDGASRDQACAAAGSVAVANGAVLQSCAVDDGRSLVVVTERRAAAWPVPATARSRAGPVSR
jgi:secretion/DNA translocation related TadE-like protein